MHKQGTAAATYSREVLSLLHVTNKESLDYTFRDTKVTKLSYFNAEDDKFIDNTGGMKWNKKCEAKTINQATIT